jgi:hypothetical protein
VTRRAHVLNEKSDTTVEIPHITLEDEVLLGLGRDARLEVS